MNPPQREGVADGDARGTGCGSGSPAAARFRRRSKPEGAGTEQDPHRMPELGRGRVGRVLVLVDDPRVEEIVESWAASHDCEVWWSGPEDWDHLICIHYFACVIDRSVAGRTMWDDWVDFIRNVNTRKPGLEDAEAAGGDEVAQPEVADDAESGEAGGDAEEADYTRDRSVCILVDAVEDWPLPRLDCVLHVAPQVPELKRLIEGTLDVALEREKKRLQQDDALRCFRRLWKQEAD